MKYGTTEMTAILLLLLIHMGFGLAVACSHIISGLNLSHDFGSLLCPTCARVCVCGGGGGGGVSRNGKIVSALEGI